MRTQLISLDQRGLGKREQIEWMKEKYGNLGERVLAVPDPASSNWFLAYLVPPVVVVIALLFVGGLGWYWLEDRLRSPDSSGSARNKADLNLDRDDLAEEIEREIEAHRSS
jgi:cytochrome c-type biogenesis protein CcmH/NrfF